MEAHAEEKRQEIAREATDAPAHCPPSPDDEIFHQKQEERQEEAKRAESYSSVNSTSMASHMTSPSELQSPISSDNLGSQDQFLPSVPSLPALVSGASSVSADTEGDMLKLPGIVHYPESGFSLTAESTPEAHTPPTLSKQSSTDVETPIAEPAEDAIVLSPDEDDEGYNGDGDNLEDDDSDSDEGLTMTSRKSKPHPPPEEKPVLKKVERRGTNASVGSTETAKKVVMDG